MEFKKFKTFGYKSINMISAEILEKENKIIIGIRIEDYLNAATEFLDFKKKLDGISRNVVTFEISFNENLLKEITGFISFYLELYTKECLKINERNFKIEKGKEGFYVIFVTSEEKRNKEKILKRIERKYYKETGQRIKLAVKEKTADEKGQVTVSGLSLLNPENEEKVTVTGKVFRIQRMTTKTGKIICKFFITDLNDSVSCIYFENKKNTEEINRIRNGLWLKIKGIFKHDTYSNENQILVNGTEIVEVSENLRKDSEKRKRVELHAHTKMSEMSGVMSVNDYFNRAKEFGHTAAAITDFSVAFGFPEAFKHSSEEFKVIYGIEGYVVDDEEEIIKNASSSHIFQETYTVFDIETTGLDPYKDKIIEIAAVKMKGNEIIDRFSELVNPEIPIPAEITKLTSITDEMVANSGNISEVLPKFIKFADGTILVAHNAKFDIGFVKQKALEEKLEFHLGFIDTLVLSRILIPEIRKFGLSSLVSYFNIELPNHHRATDDAEATAKVFLRLAERILSKGISRLDEINKELDVKIETSETNNTVILVRNQEGIRDLYELISKSHTEYFGKKKARIPKSLLRKYRKNFIICSSASYEFHNKGELIDLYLRGFEEEEIAEKAKFYDYIEIMPPAVYSDLIDDKAGEGTGFGTAKSLERIGKFFYNLGKKLGIPVTATGQVHYLEENESINRDILLLGSGNVRKSLTVNGKEYRFFDKKLFFRTTEEMLSEFAFLGNEAAKEIVIENTNRIADMIEKGIRPIPNGFYPPKIEGADAEVERITYLQLEKLYGNNIPEFFRERLEKELNAIISNGFSVLYLAAQKLVKKSVDNGYPVGSRGSVGSSIVAFLMGITEVNALSPHYLCPRCKYSRFIDGSGSGVDLPDATCPVCGTELKKDGHSIPFEVFMGFDGEKTPDIDLNFSGEYQSEIHKYTEEIFGKENVFRAGTITTLAEKNAFGYVKKFLEETGTKKSNAEITRISEKCEGARKTTGQHPGGMIVIPSDKSIYDFCPVQKPANDITSENTTTHFEYHALENQLVKLDVLGHDDPTILKNLQELTGVDIYSIPLDDANVMSLFSSTKALRVFPEQIGNTIGSSGIPEFGTSFVKQMLVETKPKSFNELVKISGLSHGTDVWLNNAQEYIKEGKATLNEVITVRDDIMNFLIEKEISKTTAFEIMEFVRKGKASREPEKWKEYSTIMKNAGIEEWYIDSCKKIKYMFPKGHAVAYVIMALRVAYFKVYYPLEFYTSFLNRKSEDFKITSMYRNNIMELKRSRFALELKNNLNAKEKQELFLYEILIEMYYRGIELLDVDLFKSEATEFKIDNGKIRLPLTSVDGLGKSVAEKIVSEREREEFYSIKDLMKRTKLNRTVLQLLKQYSEILLPETSQLTLF